MSLLTEFQNVENKISYANKLCLKTFGEIVYEHKNQWQCRKYDINMSTAPTLDTIKDKTPTAIRYIDDMNSFTSWNWANNYVGYMQCYVKCNQNYNLIIKAFTDDYGRIYCNGVEVATTPTSKWSDNIIIPFKTGWNKLIIMFQEEVGNDGAAINTKLSTQSFVTEMYANIMDDTTSIYS